MADRISAYGGHDSTPDGGRCGGGRTASLRNNRLLDQPPVPPYHWAVGDDRFDGASMELLPMVVPPGIPLKPAVYPWKRALFLAEQGKIDLMVSLRITPERSAYLKFTTHRAFPNPIVVFVRKDRPFHYASRADLKAYRGGISFGDTFGGGSTSTGAKSCRSRKPPPWWKTFESWLPAVSTIS
ncbi:transporter substrate-binding domain-containing protein [Geobacter sp. FeAm09]|nr:transporter substrate-binding domain-containing protein [Geobacter sp. FeAm09]